MDAKTIKEKLTTEDVIKLFCTLQGSDNVLYDAQGHPIFNTSICHGGDSDKLYYYPETGLTHCYTCGRTSDVFEITQRALDTDFKGAMSYITEFFHIRDYGFGTDAEPNLTDDWDIFQQVKDYSNETPVYAPPENIPENLLEYFYPLAAPLEWQKEGISPEVMRAFGIRVDSALQKIIIPHRDENGKLIGIRGRSYNPIEIDNGKKYMPVFIQKDMYNHPLGKNLYGLFENKEIIKQSKKVCIFEAEKSVLQTATMYGLDKCFAVATCGSSLSSEQMNMLLKLGVVEIILAFDADHVGGRGAPDTLEYEQKLFKIVKPWLPYVNVSVIFDYDHILPHKASPSDCGKEKFEELYHSRVRLSSLSEKIPAKGKYKN